MGIDARMFARIEKAHATADNIKRWSWDLCAAIGAQHFLVVPENEGTGSWSRPLPLFLESPEDSSPRLSLGEVSLAVSLAGRYYGKGYERGDILTYCAIAEWLEANIPGAKVWYGGDEGEVQPFNERERKAHRNLLYSPEGRRYFRDWTNDADNLLAKLPRCTRCVPDRSPDRYGYGPKYAAFACPGCGKTIETHDAGESWVAYFKDR